MQTLNFQSVINPTYTLESIKQLDTHPQLIAYDLNKNKYTPGFIGLNNLKANDYVNVILQVNFIIK